MYNKIVINNSVFAVVTAASPITKMLKSWKWALLLPLTMVSAVNAAPDPLPASGEDIAVFHFDTDQGAVATDALNSGATCTLGIETTWTKNGKSGGGIEFIKRSSPLGAQSSLVRLPIGSLNGKSFGISFWFLIPSQAPIDRDLYFVSNHHFYIRWVASRRTMEFGLKSPESGEFVEAIASIEKAAIAGGKSQTLDGDWFHFTGTYDGQKLRMYLDGILIGETNLQGNIADLEGLALGCQFWDPDPEGSPNQFVGILDDLRFFKPTPATK
jgi:hypothetical protein